MTSYCFLMKVDQLEKRDFAVSSTFRRTSFFDDGFLYPGMSNTAGNFWDERVLELE